MWFNTGFFIAPKQFRFNGEEPLLREVSFLFNGEKKER